MTNSSANLRQANSSASSHSRAGLAPLELTLSLPIMLFVMGLMIIAGTTGAWKTRAVTNSRQAVWRTLWPRDGHQDPNPRGWPQAATMIHDEARELMDVDPFVNHEVVRGQPLSAPTGESLTVEEGLFDMQEDVVHGFSEMERGYPVLGNMGKGQIHLKREHPILDNRWQFREMGLSSNRQRRITFMYPADNERALSQLVQRYHDAALDIVYNSDNPALDTLDNDVELKAHQPGGLPYDSPYGIGRAPDYHIPLGRPRAGLLNPDSVCADDPQRLSDDVMQPMVGEIQGRPNLPGLANAGVPGRLTRDFLRMYNRHLDFIERLLDQLEDPGTPPDVKAQIASALPQILSDKEQLEQKVEQLEDFRDMIQ